jgi:hypothetical protein
MALFLIFDEGGEGAVWFIMLLGGRGLLPNASYKENINSDKVNRIVYILLICHTYRNPVIIYSKFYKKCPLMHGGGLIWII